MQQLEKSCFLFINNYNKMIRLLFTTLTGTLKLPYSSRIRHYWFNEQLWSIIIDGNKASSSSNDFFGAWCVRKSTSNSTLLVMFLATSAWLSKISKFIIFHVSVCPTAERNWDNILRTKNWCYLSFRIQIS